MWLEILCGLIVYKLFGRFFFGDDGDVTNFDSRHSDASFVVANRLEKLYGGKAYVGLRIPDADTGSRQSIDLVLVTRTELMIVAVRNVSGFVEVSANGSWVSTSGNNHKAVVCPDPVSELTRQTEILSLYLEQRGLILPKEFIISKVILPNPNCRVTYSLDLMPEVISFDKWSKLKTESRSGFSSWIKDAFGVGKLDTAFQKLHLTLSTSPMWDKLELKGDRNILGEFIEFKGKPEEMQALQNIKRSKVSRFIVQKSTAFVGLGRSKIHLLHAPRDYRSEGSSSSEWKEVTVKAGVEVLFLPLNSKKAQKFKLSNICSMSLSV